MRKNLTGILLIIVCLIMCLGGCAASGDPVPVQSVAEILGIGPIGMIDRYAGVIEAGETVGVSADSSMEIKEITVKEGDTVTKGQVVFTYETTTLSLDKERLELEVEQTNNTITTKKNQITALKKEQTAAASADKLQYTLQIQQLELDVKEAEYTVTAKKKEIERLKVRLAEANVLSPVDGRVKAVNANGGTDPMTGEPLPLLTITQSGDFRVRGTVNELTAQTFAEGTPVIIRSRVDDETIWNGSVTMVDWENPVTNQNDYYYMPSDEMTTSSKYPFYVQLVSDIGLMLGQHVYIEQDIGQTSGDAEDAFYLPSYYLNGLGSDEDTWVWAANAKDKLEKRTVVLGNYDIAMDSYEILEGLNLDDHIAYPSEDWSVGAKVSYAEDAMSGDLMDEGLIIEGEEALVDEDMSIDGELSVDGEGLVDNDMAIEGGEGLVGDDLIIDGSDPSLNDPAMNGGLVDNDMAINGGEEGLVDESPADEGEGSFTNGDTGFTDADGEDKDEDETQKVSADSAIGGAIRDSGVVQSGTNALSPGGFVRADPFIAAIPGTEAMG
ncbi:MAG: efflux RND transporter periplasmic adaptor subunit [Ruminococcaceae bacterium]|nr:efflux RND transporter periplasmic adaptor subunit [Oscillospiraceae bacterium]